MKVFISIFFGIFAIIFLVFLKINNEKKNNQIAEQFIQAGIYFSSNNLEKSKDLYENINLRNLKLVPLNENNQLKQIIRNDGSRIYSKKDTSHKVISQVINYSMEKYYFSDEKFKLYEKFINYLSLRYKKEIILVLSPYHSESYALTLKKIPHYQDVEKKFIRLAQEKSIKLIGSYSMEKTECEDDEFYNGDHPKSNCMTKIFKQIN